MTRTCTQCGMTGDASLFVPGRNKCKACRSKNEGSRRKAASRTNLNTAEPAKPRVRSAETKPRKLRTPNAPAQEAHTKAAEVPALVLPPRKSSKRKKAELISFGDRDSMDKYIKEELQGSLEHLNELIEDNKDRLVAAQLTGNSKVIDEATKALQRSIGDKAGVVTTLMERLKLLDDLRAKSEKAKPVTFRFVTLSADKMPTIVVSRRPPDE